ncbi:MAG: hypothetical protein ACLRVT_09240 [Oscillospiraceae bacterium]
MSPIRMLHYDCVTESPDYTALKCQLSQLPGVTSMEIGSTGVDVTYDPHRITPSQISQPLGEIGYFQTRPL